MGAYINPPDCSKEVWLAQKAIESGAGLCTVWEDVPKGMLPIVLVDNGPFTAAAIGFSKDELEVFLSPNDRRPRRVFFALIEDLHTASPELAGYLR